jgi:hypothetical protein
MVERWARDPRLVDRAIAIGDPIGKGVSQGLADAAQDPADEPPITHCGSLLRKEHDLAGSHDPATSEPQRSPEPRVRIESDVATQMSKDLPRHRRTCEIQEGAREQIGWQQVLEPGPRTPVASSRIPQGAAFGTMGIAGNFDFEPVHQALEPAGFGLRQDLTSLAGLVLKGETVYHIVSND